MFLEESSQQETNRPQNANFFERLLASAIDHFIIVCAGSVVAFVGMLVTSIAMLFAFVPDRVMFAWAIQISSLITLAGFVDCIAYYFYRRSSELDFFIAEFIGVIFCMLTIKWLYFTILESSSIKATLGKRLMGIVVTDLQGNRISFKRANKRYFAKNISLITLLISFFAIALTKKKQGWHDKTAKTIVIKRKP